VTFAIRIATLDDAEAMASIFYNAIRYTNIKDYSPSQIEAWAGPSPAPDKWRARFSTRPEMLTFVASVHGLVVGFADFEPDGRVDCVYVHHEHQRRGVASGLLIRVEQEARRRRLTRLYSEASITALPLFKHQGFAVITEQEVEFRGERFKNYRVEKVGLG